MAQAVPALLGRLQDVVHAIAGGPAPFPPPGFSPVPEGPPSRRERALLVQFAWTAYTVLAARPPADVAPAEWPYRLGALVPLTQRRPDVLPALARLIDRVLTAPPLAPLPSPAGLEELLRRALPRAAGDGAPSLGDRRPVMTPIEGITVAVDFAPHVPEAPHAVVARLRLLAGVLAAGGESRPLEVRRGLFRLGWTGWERLQGEAPYDTARPYELVFDDEAERRTPRITPLAAPPALIPLLATLLDRSSTAVLPTLKAVRHSLALMAQTGGTSAPGASAATVAAPAPPILVAAAAAAEADRLLGGLIAAGLVHPGPGAADARSLDERLAVTSLAWSVYRAATGSPPIVLDTDASSDQVTPYRSLAMAAPDIAPPLAAVVDATLQPDAPASVPGVAAWLAAATQAAEWTDGPTSATTRSADGPLVAARPAAAGRAPRRRIHLLPEDDRARLPWWPIAAGLAGAVIVWRLSAGP